jgi:phage terminase small subunit
MTSRGLTPRQQRFVNEYLLDRNGSAAYRRAGYKAKGNAAETGASRLLRNAQVADAVAAAEQRHLAGLEINARAVLRELARCAFSRLTDVAKWDKDGVEFLDSATLSEDAKAAVESVSSTPTPHGNALRIKMHSKLAALDKLCRHLGLYRDLGPLEVILGRLPPDQQKAVRAAISELVRGEAGLAHLAKREADAPPGC